MGDGVEKGRVKRGSPVEKAGTGRLAKRAGDRQGWRKERGTVRGGEKSGGQVGVAIRAGDWQRWRKERGTDRSGEKIGDRHGWR